MTDSADDQPIAIDQLLDLKALFQAIASGDEAGAERMIRGLDADERLLLPKALKDAWESQLWLFGVATNIVGRVLTPTKENL